MRCNCNIMKSRLHEIWKLVEKWTDFSIFYNFILCLIKTYSDWTLSATVGQSSETQNQVRQSLSYYMHGSHWPSGTHDSILLVAVYGLCNACMSSNIRHYSQMVMAGGAWGGIHPPPVRQGQGQGERPEGSRHPGSREWQPVSMSGQGNQREFSGVIVAYFPICAFQA